MNRLTKEQIQAIPLFEGVTLDEFIVVTSEQSALSAIKSLTACEVIGFDTKSKGSL